MIFMTIENLYYVFEEVYDYLHNNDEDAPLYIFQEVKDEYLHSYAYLCYNYENIDRMRTYDTLLMIGDDFMDEFKELVEEFEKYTGRSYSDCREIVALTMAIFKVSARHLPIAIKR